MNRKNAATDEDAVINPVDHPMPSLANSAASAEQLEALLTSELTHDRIACERQYLETYLDSDATSRVPLDAEQLQDILEAAFDRDATLAREYLEELNGERGPKCLGDTTLEITIVCTQGKEPEYESLFDPSDGQDLKHFIEIVDMRASGKLKAQPTTSLETQALTKRCETIAVAAVRQPGSAAVEFREKTTGTGVRELLGGGDLPPALQSALKQMAPDSRFENAKSDSGTYRGRITAESEKSLFQQITSHSAVVHRKDLLDMIPSIGENGRIAYRKGNARVLSVKESSETQELRR
jgi:hypothetical protein